MAPTMQSYVFKPYLLIGVFTTIMALIIAYQAWKRRRAMGALWLTYLEIGVTIWSFAAIFEGASASAQLRFLWSKISYFGITTTPLFFLLFAYEYSRQVKIIRPQKIFLLAIFPLVTIFIALTNDVHHLLWTSVTIDPTTFIGTYGHGFYFGVLVVYSYMFLIVGLFFLLRALFQFSAYYRTQIILLLIGSCFPFLANIFYVFKLVPIKGFDWTPFAFSLTGIVLAWSLFRLHIFKLVPIARTQLIEQMSDGLIVLDADDQIIDLNPSILKTLGINRTDYLGQPVSGLPVVGQKINTLLDLGDKAVIDVEFNRENLRRVLEIRLFAIKSRETQVVGRVLIVTDITVRKQIEEEREKLIHELQESINEVNTLHGLLPICANCKKIRDDKGYWHDVENYIARHSDADFSHSICPDCMDLLYPELSERIKARHSIHTTPADNQPATDESK